MQQGGDPSTVCPSMLSPGCRVAHVLAGAACGSERRCPLQACGKRFGVGQGSRANQKYKRGYRAWWMAIAVEPDSALLANPQAGTPHPPRTSGAPTSQYRTSASGVLTRVCLGSTARFHQKWKLMTGNRWAVTGPAPERSMGSPPGTGRRVATPS
jgi:hypothetical protein